MRKRASTVWRIGTRIGILTALASLAVAPSPSGAAESGRTGPRNESPGAVAARAEAVGVVPLIVEVRAPSEAESVATNARRNGGTNIRRYQFMPHLALRGGARTVRALARDPNVVRIAKNIPEPPALGSSVPLVRADDVARLGMTGAGVTVAILDTGIDTDHPFFRDNNGGNPGRSRIVSQACFSDPGNLSKDAELSLCPNGRSTDLTSSNVQGVANCLDDGVQICRHGTHVAGIAAGDGAGVPGSPPAGVAPDANIISIQVFTRFNDAFVCGDRPTCLLSYVSDQIAGMDRVAALHSANPGWRIVAANMSLGGWYFFSACDDDPRKSAIDSLLRLGVATVIAAGNEGLLSAVAAPGCISTALTVGSTTNNDVISSFSNRGPLLDFFAPGSRINSSVVNGFGSLSGTSMATPHVAGALALLRQAAPTRPVLQLVDDLRTTGLPIAYPTSDVAVSDPKIAEIATTPRIDVVAALAPVPPALGCSGATLGSPSAGYNHIVGTPLDDNLRGTAAKDVIYGLGGSDVIAGMGGDDVIVAMEGDDRVSGGDGADTVCGGPGQDLLSGDGGNDRISGDSGNDRIDGGDGDDVLDGGGGNDGASGGAGDDRVNGGPGNDRLDGGGGNDSLDGGGGSDVVLSERAVASFVLVPGTRDV